MSTLTTHTQLAAHVENKYGHKVALTLHSLPCFELGKKNLKFKILDSGKFSLRAYQLKKKIKMVLLERSLKALELNINYDLLDQSFMYCVRLLLLMFFSSAKVPRYGVVWVPGPFPWVASGGCRGVVSGGGGCIW